MTSTWFFISTHLQHCIYVGTPDNVMSRHSVRIPNSSAFWTPLYGKKHTKGKTQFETNCCCRLSVRGARFWPSGGMMQYAYMSELFLFTAARLYGTRKMTAWEDWGCGLNLVQQYSLNFVRSKQILSLHCRNILRPAVTICTTSLTSNNSMFCPHSVFMCFVWVWEQTAIIYLYSIKLTLELQGVILTD